MNLAESVRTGKRTSKVFFGATCNSKVNQEKIENL